MGAYIGAAYWFTSSTSFANPAITVGRMFSNSFAGIAPSSVPSFVAAQIVGGVLAVGLIRLLYPDVTPAQAATVVVPHTSSPPELGDLPTNGSAGAPDAPSPDPADPSGPSRPPTER